MEIGTGAVASSSDNNGIGVRTQGKWERGGDTPISVSSKERSNSPKKRIQLSDESAASPILIPIPISIKRQRLEGVVLPALTRRSREALRRASLSAAVKSVRFAASTSPPVATVQGEEEVEEPVELVEEDEWSFLR